MLHLKRSAMGLFLATAAAPAGAGNLIANPDFSADISGWSIKTTGSATVTYSANSGSPAQGSIHLTASNGDSAQANQCVALTDSIVDLIARQYAATSIAVQTATAEITAYDQPNCAGNILGFSAFNPVPVDGYFEGTVVLGWNEISALHKNLSNLPPASALVSLYVHAGAGGSADYYFDDVRFGANGTLPVKLLSFDVQ
jgi:hypothetical protein